MTRVGPARMKIESTEDDSRFLRGEPVLRPVAESAYEARKLTNRTLL